MPTPDGKCGSSEGDQAYEREGDGRTRLLVGIGREPKLRLPGMQSRCNAECEQGGANDPGAYQAGAAEPTRGVKGDDHKQCTNRNQRDEACEERRETWAIRHPD